MGDGESQWTSCCIGIHDGCELTLILVHAHLVEISMKCYSWSVAFSAPSCGHDEDPTYIGRLKNRRIGRRCAVHVIVVFIAIAVLILVQKLQLVQLLRVVYQLNIF